MNPVFPVFLGAHPEQTWPARPLASFWFFCLVGSKGPGLVGTASCVSSRAVHTTGAPEGLGALCQGRACVSLA